MLPDTAIVGAAEPNNSQLHSDAVNEILLLFGRVQYIVWACAVFILSVGTSSSCGLLSVATPHTRSVEVTVGLMNNLEL